MVPFMKAPKIPEPPIRLKGTNLLRQEAAQRHEEHEASKGYYMAMLLIVLGFNSIMLASLCLWAYDIKLWELMGG